MLTSLGDFTEYSVEKATLELVFLKVIHKNEVLAGDSSKKEWMEMLDILDFNTLGLQ